MSTEEWPPEATYQAMRRQQRVADGCLGLGIALALFTGLLALVLR